MFRRIGFTGTRHDMTEPQFTQFTRLLNKLIEQTTQRLHFHHGDCIGADARAAKAAWGRCAYIICHPPIKTEHQARTNINHETRQPKSHFARNRDIVDETELLIACPQYAEPITPETKGGTAYTVNYARKRGKPVMVIRPDGSIESEIQPGEVRDE